MTTKVSGLNVSALAQMLCPALKEASSPLEKTVNKVWLLSDSENRLSKRTREEFKAIVQADLIFPQGQRELRFALKKNDKMGWELVACKKILPGEFIGEYAGEGKEPTSQNEQDYSLNGINSFYKRSLAAMANDGFPNMKAYPLGKTRIGLFALTEIAKGEPLTYQYGATHSVKTSIIHRESHSQKLEKYFEKIGKEGPEALQKKLDEISSRENTPLTKAEIPSFLEDELFIERLVYILTTPASLYTILLKKILTPQAVRKILQHPRLFKIEDYSAWPHRLIQDILLFVPKTYSYSQNVIENLLSLAEEYPAALLLSQAEMMIPSCGGAY